MSITVLLAAVMLFAPGVTDSIDRTDAATLPPPVIASWPQPAAAHATPPNLCNEACMEMFDSEQNKITNFCVRGEEGQLDGEDCWASVTDCSIRVSTSCQGGGGGQGEQFALTSIILGADGSLLAEVTQCATDERVIAVEMLDFQHTRQQVALRVGSTI